jgi:hypothetical protein
MNEIYRLHGIPKVILRDRDPKFTGNFWKYEWKMSGTTLAMSLAYHRQTYGQIEIVKKCLEGYLCCYFSYKQFQWVKWLPLVE